ncbi:NUDIX domain-containing protein [Deinococcus yavapaiensis]|uniref:NUDIX domain-containing protein n=1 Tax=Deinococcus yavapaiensis TaxID=309889 RepID=UPI000DA25688
MITAYGLPGGHLWVGETLVQCARREVLEETGWRVQFAATMFEATVAEFGVRRTLCHSKSASSRRARSR